MDMKLKTIEVKFIVQYNKYNYFLTYEEDDNIDVWNLLQGIEMRIWI